MTLSEYLNAQPRRRGVLKKLAQDSGLDYSTVWNVARRGHLLDSYRKAKRLSLATGGAVSIAELCDSDAEPEADEPRATGTDD